MLIPSSLQEPVDARNAAPACRVAFVGVPSTMRARLARALTRSAALAVSFADVPASEAARGAEPWVRADIAVTWHGPPAIDATPLVATWRQAAPIGPVLVIVDVGCTAPAGLAADPGADWIAADASSAAIHDAVVRVLVTAGHPTILAAAPRVVEHLDRCDVGTYRTSPSGAILAATGYLHTLVGESGADEPVRLLTRPADHPDGRADAHAPGGVRHVTAQVESPDGSVLVLEGAERELRDAFGRVVAREGFARNVTARAQAGHRPHFVAAMLDHVQQAVIGIDGGLRVTYWNRGASRAVGRAASEVRGGALGEALGLEAPEAFKAATLATLAADGRAEMDLTCERPGGVRWLAHCRITRLVIDGALAGYLCVLADVTDARRLERDLSDAITRHQRLVDDAHSRVRTSLDTLSGLLDVYAPSGGDPAMRSVMRNTRNRIQAIAILHDWLQQAPGRVTVDLRSYLERLTRYLAVTCAAEPAPALECRAVPLQVPVTTATRIGLIVNELAVNAMKYAFDGQDDARVVIALSMVAPTRVVLEVSDNGRGLPAHVDPATATSLGLRLVSDLASSIGATVEITRDAGTTFRLAFAAER